MEFKIWSKIVRIKSCVDCHRSEREETSCDFDEEDKNMLMPKFRQHAAVFSKNISTTLYTVFTAYYFKIFSWEHWF